MRTVVIGLGNPILSDDSVGVRVARELGRVLAPDRCRAPGDVEILELYAGGIRLLDALAGYDRAFIVDAMVTGQYPYGAIQEYSLENLPPTRYSICVHDMTLPVAIELGRLSGVPLPGEIRILGIEARDVENFSETLTQEVADAVPVAVQQILRGLRESSV